MCEPCNSFLAEVRESQGTLLKKIGCKPCIDNHNYKNSLQNVYKNKVYKNEDFFTFSKIYSKINMNVVKTSSPWQ